MGWIKAGEAPFQGLANFLHRVKDYFDGTGFFLMVHRQDEQAGYKG
jgi:hypothetical protein